MIFGTKSAAVDWIVAGLGNPGQAYANTRHNMGFLTVDLLAEREKVKLNRVKFKAAYQIFPFAGAKCLVMKPQTYMNLSGEAVGEAARFYHIEPSHILVIYDDISLPVGKLRVRPSGSAGGHNGIKNLIAHLGTQDFPRIKIGVGAPGNSGNAPGSGGASGDSGSTPGRGGNAPEHGDLINWVTGEPSMADRKILFDTFGRAIDAAECVIRYGCQKAMNDFNG